MGGYSLTIMENYCFLYVEHFDHLLSNLIAPPVHLWTYQSNLTASYSSIAQELGSAGTGGKNTMTY